MATVREEHERRQRANTETTGARLGMDADADAAIAREMAEEDVEGELGVVDTSPTQAGQGITQNSQVNQPPAPLPLLDEPLPPNLRSLLPLAHLSLSSHKPSNGPSALLSPSLDHYWQSDGPQPHLLTLHWPKMVEIVRMRIFIDYSQDESYTPTKMSFWAGAHGSSGTSIGNGNVGEVDALGSNFGGYGMCEIGGWEGLNVRGWVEVPLRGCGGRSSKRYKREAKDVDQTRPGRSSRLSTRRRRDGRAEDTEICDDPYDGSILRARVVQVRILENHQNGKDTHVRGLQVWGQDDRPLRGARQQELEDAIAAVELTKGKEEAGTESDQTRRGDASNKGGRRGIKLADWMGEVELR